MKKRIIPIRQRDLTDCGAACLAAVLAYYGNFQPISRIRQLAGTDKRGTNITGMIQAAEYFGLQARGAKSAMENLPLIPVPAILHWQLQNGLHHYVVLEKVGKTTVRFMDPGDGHFHKMSIEAFQRNWTGILILLSPSSEFRLAQPQQSIRERFLQLAHPHYRQLLFALIGALIYTVLGFSTTVYIRKIVDDVVQGENSGLLHALGILMVLLLLIQTILGLIRSVVGITTGQAIDARLITGYYRHLFRLPQRFFDTMRVGEMISRVNDALKIRLFINDIAIGLVLNAAIVFGSLMLMWLFNWRLALLVAGFFPVYVLLHVITNNINRKWQRRLMEQSADLKSRLVESLEAASTVRRLGLEDYVVDKTESSFIRLMQSIYRTTVYNLYAATAAEFVNRLLVIGMLWYGTWLVLRQLLTVGELLSFYTMIGYCTGPVAALIATGKGIQDAVIAADRLFEITDLESDLQPSVCKVELDRDQIQDIRFQEVSFRYGSGALVFDGLSLCVKKGEATAIVGESGSGKSTLAHLLQQLYPLQGGQIYIGSIPLQHFDTGSLRKRMAIVPQQVHLFSGTIAENIAIGDPYPDMAGIIAASRSAGAHEFIEKLPGTYDCQVGEKGASLSGGQQQRLAIARAIYREPEILIMDEATAHLDPMSELRIQQLVADFRAAGKTVIIIAHRLSTVRWCDTIHLLKSGRLVDSGSHESLMVNCIEYAQLWEVSSPQNYAGVYWG